MLADLPSRRLFWYWIVGSPAAWLAFAGIPMAGLMLHELRARAPRYLLAMLAPLVVFYLLPSSVTGVILGEWERTLLFVYPLAAVAAGATFVRWEDERGARGRVVLTGLMATTAAQTILFESIYGMFW